MLQVSSVILTKAASHCVTPARAVKPAYKLILMICRPAAWQDDATTTKRELWSSWRRVPLRHCLGHGLGSGMRACRPVTAGMAGAVAQGSLGTGRATAAVLSCVPARATRLMCFCRIT